MSTTSMSRLLRMFVLTLAALLAITATLGASASIEPEDDPGSPVLSHPADVAVLDETDRATALLNLSITDTAVLDETNRAIALIDLRATGTAVLDETDRATALIDLAPGSVVALTPNQRSIAMSEDKLAPGGRLATWDDVEATAATAFVPWPGGQPY